MDNGESPPHLYLPGPRRGLFNRQAAKSHKEIILTEAAIDSLTLINAGIHNTILAMAQTASPPITWRS